MLDLDFAFFNMINSDKQGLVYRKFFLDRLAPYLFAPRVENLINFCGLGLKGCNMLLPMGQGNWNLLEADRKKMLLEKSVSILEDYGLAGMAVDRRLKNELLELSNDFPMLFGDNFIKALAAVLVKDMISRRRINKLVVAGDFPEMPRFIETLKQYDIPVSIQNYRPSQYEIIAYRLLYEKGVAVSTSYINPQGWEKGDLIILFETAANKLELIAPESFFIDLTADCNSLAPEIGNTLRSRGLDTSIHTVAPIMESCLWTKAGFWNVDEEQVNANKDNSFDLVNKWEAIYQVGEDIGLWDFFLDKAW